MLKNLTKYEIFGPVLHYALRISKKEINLRNEILYATHPLNTSLGYNNSVYLHVIGSLLDRGMACFLLVQAKLLSYKDEDNHLHKSGRSTRCI